MGRSFIRVPKHKKRQFSGSSRRRHDPRSPGGKGTPSGSRRKKKRTGGTRFGGFDPEVPHVLRHFWRGLSAEQLPAYAKAWSSRHNQPFIRPEEILERLIKLADHRRGCKVPYDDRRREFETSQALKFLFDLPCLVCGQPSEQRHHIIELKNGGRNFLANLIPICVPCHCKIHPWMEGDLPETRQMNDDYRSMFG